MNYAVLVVSVIRGGYFQMGFCPGDLCPWKTEIACGPDLG